MVLISGSNIGYPFELGDKIVINLNVNTQETINFGKVSLPRKTEYKRRNFH